jgi:CheY-like chemotaxis protein
MRNQNLHNNMQDNLLVPIFGNILVIDDDDAVRNVVTDLFKGMNIHYFECNNGIEGVQIFREHAAEIDLVLLDFEMPNVSGDWVYAQIKSIKPSQKIIIFSGYTKTTLEERFGHALICYLAKPFHLNYLIHKINQCLQDNHVQ